MSDNQATEPAVLDLDSASTAFAALDNEVVEKTEEELLAEKAVALDAESDTDTQEDDTQEPAKITVEVDGKVVELTPEQVAEAYKSGLRQSDYSKKTAELTQEKNLVQEQAKKERDTYAQKLNHYSIQLEGALSEQSKTNWAELLEKDPVEYLKQQHLYQQRQAAYQSALAERQQIEQQQQQEYKASFESYIAKQNELLIEKIPAWKDEAKATAEKTEIKEYLKNIGLTDQEISSIADHRHVVIVRKAMQMDKLLKQAPNATKRVEKAPVKVERPGTAESGNKDATKAAINRLKKSGSIDDAASAFATLL